MALNGTMVKIETVTVGSGGASSIDFQNIPATYTDLLVKISARGSRSAIDSNLAVSFNNSTADFTNRYLEGTGSGVSGGGVGRFIGSCTAATATANTFGSCELYIPNYASNVSKSFNSEATMETNATTSYMQLTIGLWNNTSAINRVTLSLLTSDNFVQNTTATLYGISRTTAQIKATGGMVYDTADYVYHLFNSSGTFSPLENLSVDYLVVAGGGGGGSGNFYCAGGGGGGFRTGSLSVTPGNLTVTVGAGGATNVNGSNSVFSTITSTGGGRGGVSGVNAGGNGGSGGGAGGAGGGGGTPQTAIGTGNAGNYSPSEGNNGGNGWGESQRGAGGGGGGAGAVGGNAAYETGGNGGNGSSSSITGTSVTYAGGGGGGVYFEFGGVPGNGGTGGGGKGGKNNDAVNGTANLGGGGGGAGNSADSGKSGGSGVVIVRYKK
jgi:hypothetical protein